MNRHKFRKGVELFFFLILNVEKFVLICLHIQMSVAAIFKLSAISSICLQYLQSDFNKANSEHAEVQNA